MGVFFTLGSSLVDVLRAGVVELALGMDEGFSDEVDFLGVIPVRCVALGVFALGRPRPLEPESLAVELIVVVFFLVLVCFAYERVQYSHVQKGQLLL